MAFIRYDAVIFDLDSTLLDTFPAVCSAIEQALRRFNLPDGRVREIAKESWGEHFEEMLRCQVLSAGGDPLIVSRMAAAITKNFTADFARAHVKTFAGMDRLLHTLAGIGIKLCVLTNTGDPYAEALTDLFYPGLFACAHGTSDRILPKPMPSGILYIAAQLSIPAGRILMIGDSLEDILAARAAGADCLIANWAEVTGIDPSSGHDLPPAMASPLECLSYITRGQGERI